MNRTLRTSLLAACSIAGLVGASFIGSTFLVDDASAQSAQGQKRAGQSGGGMAGQDTRGYRGGIGELVDEVLRGRGRRVIIILEEEEGDDGPPAWSGGAREENPHMPSSAGGGSGGNKSDVYSDLWIIERDDDGVPIYYTWTDSDDDGINDTQVASDIYNGFVQPLDAEGNPIPLDAEGVPYENPTSPPASYTLADGTVVDGFPTAADTSEVDIGRANVARAPDQVLDHSLDEAVTKLFEADSIALDPAGRLVFIVDDVPTTIDSPLENLAMYVALMTDGVLVYVDENNVTHTISLPAGFDPASLLGAATDKAAAMTIDEVVYLNTILGINYDTDEDGVIEANEYWTSPTYEYDRLTTYSAVTITYIEVDLDNPANTTEYTKTVYDAVFGSDWTDSTTGDIDDLTQAADDARAVIEFLHQDNIVLVDYAPST